MIPNSFLQLQMNLRQLQMELIQLQNKQVQLQIETTQTRQLQMISLNFSQLQKTFGLLAVQIWEPSRHRQQQNILEIPK